MAWLQISTGDLQCALEPCRIGFILKTATVSPSTHRPFSAHGVPASMVGSAVSDLWLFRVQPSGDLTAL